MPKIVDPFACWRGSDNGPQNATLCKIVPFCLFNVFEGKKNDRSYENHERTVVEL